MKIAILTTQTPFISGGGESLAKNLAFACRQKGHEVDIISHPFSDKTPNSIRIGINLWKNEDILKWHIVPDVVICLKFPCYYVEHPNKVIWLLHQHRSVYDLWDYLIKLGHHWSTEDEQLKKEISNLDNHYLQGQQNLYTISDNVSKRLKGYNQISAPSLLQPPALDKEISLSKTLIYSGGYIFAPSRLEPLKRQALILDALKQTKTAVKVIICGNGSEEENLKQLIKTHNLGNRVKLLSQQTDKQVVSLYKKSLAVFFAPYDEDYGYVTLEANLCKKAVLTCIDSGGPLQFVQHQQTGYIEEPDPIAIAARMDQLYQNKSQAKKMGKLAYKNYQKMNISWDAVVNGLLTSK